MNKSEAGKLGSIKSAEISALKKKQRIEEYNNNPSICKNCGKPLPYEKRHNRFCCNSCSASYNNVNRKRITKTFKCLNCGKEQPLKHGTSNKYCSLKCQADHKYKEYIKRWKEGKESGLCGEYGLSSYIRRYLLEKIGCKCEKCGWGEKNQYTGNYVLEVHHKDGDYTNNSEDNLEVLCPNCHGLTKTFKNCGGHKGRIGRNKYRK